MIPNKNLEFTEEELHIIDDMLENECSRGRPELRSVSKKKISSRKKFHQLISEESSPLIETNKAQTEKQKENLKPQFWNPINPSNLTINQRSQQPASLTTQSCLKNSNSQKISNKSPLAQRSKPIPLQEKEIDPNHYITDAGKNEGLLPLVPIDTSAARYWYYLRSKSFRLYQFKAVETCLFYNTFVSLPTGLGKTFIAVNVILNYYKWFPTGKMFFLAPTRPLVFQQKEALECITSIRIEDICQLNGQIGAKKRQKFYQEKRIFFLTPQTMNNDLNDKLIDPKEIVLIIVDEAHKSIGKFAYTNIIKHFENSKAGIRIIALSATPGNNPLKIQEVLTNLCIARLEAKDEDDLDVKPYIHSKEIREVIVKQTNGISSVSEKFNELISTATKTLNDFKLFPAKSKLYIRKPWEVHRLKVVEILQEFNRNQNEYTAKIGAENSVLFYEVISTLTSLCYMKKILSDQGLQSFHEALISFKNNYRVHSSSFF